MQIAREWSPNGRRRTAREAIDMGILQIGRLDSYEPSLSSSRTDVPSTFLTPSCSNLIVDIGPSDPSEFWRFRGTRQEHGKCSENYSAFFSKPQDLSYRSAERLQYPFRQIGKKRFQHRIYTIPIK